MCRSRPIRTFWYKGAEFERNNFGDALAPLIVEKFLGCDAVWSEPKDAELVVIGSILGLLPPDWSGVVIGAGTIRAVDRPDLRGAKVLGVRGRQTQDASTGAADAILGDPGILIPDIVPYSGPSDLPLVVAPHYVDDQLRDRYPDATWVDIRGPATTIAGVIAAADLVITSSLHALIAADAYGVPHIYEPHPDVLGGLWKFTDYVSAIPGAAPIVPGVRRLTDRAAMQSAQAQLRALFLHARALLA